MFPSRVSTSEFTYNFVEQFEQEVSVMSKFKLRMRSFARKLQSKRVPRERPFPTSTNVDLAVELARLRSANADLRIQLAAFRTLDVQYSSHVASLEVEKGTLMDDFFHYISEVESQYSNVVETHVAVEEDLRSSLEEARMEAEFYKRHAQELVHEMYTPTASISRFSDDSQVGRHLPRGVASSPVFTSSVDEHSRATDSDQSSVSTRDEADTALVDAVAIRPMIWRSNSSLDSTYKMIVDMCDMKTEEPLTSFLSFSEEEGFTPSVPIDRAKMRASLKSGPLKIIQERTITRRARWEEIQL